MGGWTTIAVAAVLCSVASPIAFGQAAQTPAQAAAPPTQAQSQQPPGVLSDADGGRIRLLSGKSLIITTDFDIKRVVITNPEVADGTPISSRELVIDGKVAGTISLIIWGDTRRVHYDLVVEPGVSSLEQQLHELFPGEDIRVKVSEGAVILYGRVTNNELVLRAGQIATAALPKQQVINMLQLPGGGGSQQVMLQVRFAEVNKKAVEELGVNMFATRTGFATRATTEQFSAPTIDDTNPGQANGSGLVFADLLNIFFFQRNQGIGAVVKALQQNGNFESLAEPNLIAYNGKEASFLAGGEFPVPIVSGNTGVPSVTYREYGVRLKFTPTIAGDTIRLKVRPEVSTLDFANGVTLGGFRIPALQTRYAETEVELRDGQSFAIAGLLNHIDQQDRANIPLLSKIPIIGNLFKSKALRTEDSELMVLITPRLTRPLNPDEVPPLPTIKPPSGTGRGGGGGDVAGQLKGGAGVVDAPGGRGGK
jgi:pilus assembly protein CpaC